MMPLRPQSGLAATQPSVLWPFIFSAINILQKKSCKPFKKCMATYLQRVSRQQRGPVSHSLSDKLSDHDNPAHLKGKENAFFDVKLVPEQ